MKAMKFLVGNDNGNSEQKLRIDGVLVQSPNVNCDDAENPYDAEDISERFITNLHDYLYCEIASPSCKAGTYVIGKAAVDYPSSYKNTFKINRRENKVESDLPIVNTLGHLAAEAVIRAYQENKQLPDKIKLNVDMATSLPIEQWDNGHEIFAKKFMEGPHQVVVLVGDRRIHVEIQFDYVHVVREGTPTTFSLQYDRDGSWRSDDLFTHLGKNVTGQLFEGKRVLHVSIGDGTTDLPVTEGNRFLKQFNFGVDHGAGYALEDAKHEYIKLTRQKNATRQKIAEQLINADGLARFQDEALQAVRIPARNQAEHIKDAIEYQLEATQMEIDYILVYGGGSILLQEALKNHLEKIKNETKIDYFYVPEKYAIIMEVDGLDFFVHSPIFQGIKEKKAV